MVKPCVNPKPSQKTGNLSAELQAVSSSQKRKLVWLCVSPFVKVSEIVQTKWLCSVVHLWDVIESSPTSSMETFKISTQERRHPPRPSSPEFLGAVEETGSPKATKLLLFTQGGL